MNNTTKFKKKKLFIPFHFFNNFIIHLIFSVINYSQFSCLSFKNRNSKKSKSKSKKLKNKIPKNIFKINDFLKTNKFKKMKHTFKKVEKNIS